MNDLITINQPITSMQIAEITGKRHADVMRDIRDEIEKLAAGGISNERKFALDEYIDAKGEKRPCFILSKEGVLQLAARYDAVTRAKLIELAMRAEKPKSALEALALTVQALQEQDARLKQLETTTQAIKDTIIQEPDNWREEINRMFNQIVDRIGGEKFKEVRHESYRLLEQRAHVDLSRRLMNLRSRMLAQGASKSAIEKANKLDVIEQDPKLREIYGKIISEYYIKYVA